MKVIFNGQARESSCVWGVLERTRGQHRPGSRPGKLDYAGSNPAAPAHLIPQRLGQFWSKEP